MLALFASAVLLHGHVLDSATGKGLPEVLVSNGRDVAATDSGGGYALPAAGRFVFVIKPSGWAQAQPGRFHNPLPAEEVNDAHSDLNFALRRVAEPDTFDVLVTTDPQPANEREVGYLERSFGRPLAHSRAFQFGLTLGDVTYDRPDLYPGINAALDEIGIPWFVVNGNHDLMLGVAGEHAVDAFETTYGPSTYAFEWGQAVFVAINDVRHEGGPRYHGGLVPDQRAFLQALFARLPPNVPVVVYCHIPWFAADPFSPPVFPASDRAFLFGLLAKYHTLLVLSGHTHVQRRVTYDSTDGWHGALPLKEANVAALCGGFWGGPLDSAGIPVSTMSDGTPPGYAILHVAPGRLSTDYRRRDDLISPEAGDARMALHVPAAIAPRRGFVSFYANVFDAAPDADLRARVDDRGWLPMKLSIGWDPRYAAAFLAQDASARPSKTTRLPDPTLCFHLWRGILPADLALGQHTLTVQAGADTATATFEIRTAN